MHCRYFVATPTCMVTPKGKRGAVRPVERYLGHPEMAYTPDSNLAYS